MTKLFCFSPRNFFFAFSRSLFSLFNPSNFPSSDKRRCSFTNSIIELWIVDRSGLRKKESGTETESEEKFLTYWIVSYWTENVRKMILSFPSGERFRLFACYVLFSAKNIITFVWGILFVCDDFLANDGKWVFGGWKTFWCVESFFLRSIKAPFLSW